MSLFRPLYTWSMQFAQNGAGSISPLTDLIGQRSMSWATLPVPGVGSSFYIPAFRDPLSTTGTATPSNPHDLQWFYDNHPDWLMYPNSATSTPSTGGSGNLWAVNTASRDVQQYMLDYAAGHVNAGYPFLAMDNVAAFNANGVQGHYAGATPGVGVAPSFGGVWDQQYTGVAIDPAFAADVFDYLQFMRVGINRLNAGTWLNAKINHSDVADSIKVATYGDMVLRESQWLHGDRGDGETDFIDGLTPGTDWYAQLAAMNSLYDKQTIISFNYLANHRVVDATEPEIRYAVANYYLTRGKRTFFEMQNGGSGSRDSGTLITYPASFTVSLGDPLEPPPIAGAPNSSGGGYQRSFATGMVVVWPSITGSCTYTVPAGTWTDQFGNSVSPGVATLSPDTSVTPNRANAIVLVKAP